MESLEFDPQLVIAILREKAKTDQLLALHLESAMWQSIAVSRSSREVPASGHQEGKKNPLEVISDDVRESG